MVFGAMLFRPTPQSESVIQFGCTSFQTDIKELVDSDLTLIYHHLQAGADLMLEQFVKNGEPCVAVYFKRFRIGTLAPHISKVVMGYYVQGKRVACSIRDIKREKFLPPSSIQIDIKVYRV